ncbi:MAG: hypothetical protein NDJ94_22270 [Vicinamibacteria bacterium]|nr:hypothetical protein [Vicinamibacteria bacterium]
MVLASLFAPGVSVVAEAVHVATHDTDTHHDGTRGVASELSLLQHGHAHDPGTAEHDHPLLVAGTTGVRMAAPTFESAASGLGCALEVARAANRGLSSLSPSAFAGVGPPRPPGSVSILRI